jgi:hypothetical protein
MFFFQLSETQKDLLRQSWKVIYSEIGQSLCYVGGAQSSSTERSVSSDVTDTVETSTPTEPQHRGVAEPFFRLFEEYPQSRTFFVHLGSASLDSLQADLRLSRALQEHAVRVIQVSSHFNESFAAVSSYNPKRN